METFKRVNFYTAKLFAELSLLALSFIVLQQIYKLQIMPLSCFPWALNASVFVAYTAYEEGQYSPILIRFSDVDQVHYHCLATYISFHNKMKYERFFGTVILNFILTSFQLPVWQFWVRWPAGSLKHKNLHTRYPITNSWASQVKIVNWIKLRILSNGIVFCPFVLWNLGCVEQIL